MVKPEDEPATKAPEATEAPLEDEADAALKERFARLLERFWSRPRQL